MANGRVNMEALGKILGLDLNGYEMVNKNSKDGWITFEDKNPGAARSDVDRPGVQCTKYYTLNDKGMVEKKEHCFGKDADGDEIDENSVMARLGLESLESGFTDRYNEDLALIPSKAGSVERKRKHAEVLGRLVLAALGERMGHFFSQDFAGMISQLRAKIGIKEPDAKPKDTAAVAEKPCE